jgi:hypothetical protein
MEYGAFKTKFEADAVADIISKQPIDVNASNHNIDIMSLKVTELRKYLQQRRLDTSGLKNTLQMRLQNAIDEENQNGIEATSENVREDSDVSIPYDAPAKLAYEASDKSMEYGAFKTKFEADAVADIISKQPIDVSIPYDAPAKLAYEASDKSMEYGAFKTKFEADAVADATAKKVQI